MRASLARWLERRATTRAGVFDGKAVEIALSGPVRRWWNVCTALSPTVCSPSARARQRLIRAGVSRGSLPASLSAHLRRPQQVAHRPCRWAVEVPGLDPRGLRASDERQREHRGEIVADAVGPRSFLLRRTLGFEPSWRPTHRGAPPAPLAATYSALSAAGGCSKGSSLARVVAVFAVATAEGTNFTGCGPTSRPVRLNTSSSRPSCTAWIRPIARARRRGPRSQRAACPARTRRRSPGPPRRFAQTYGERAISLPEWLAHGVLLRLVSAAAQARRLSRNRA